MYVHRFPLSKKIITYSFQKKQEKKVEVEGEALAVNINLTITDSRSLLPFQDKIFFSFSLLKFISKCATFCMYFGG